MKQTAYNWLHPDNFGRHWLPTRIVNETGPAKSIIKRGAMTAETTKLPGQATRTAMIHHPTPSTVPSHGPHLHRTHSSHSIRLCTIQHTSPDNWYRHYHSHSGYELHVHNWSYPTRLQKMSLLAVQNLYILSHPINFLFDVVPAQTPAIVLTSITRPLASSLGVDKHSRAETFQHGCTQSEIKVVHI